MRPRRLRPGVRTFSAYRSSSGYGSFACRHRSSPPTHTGPSTLDRVEVTGRIERLVRNHSSCSDRCRRTHRYQQVQDLPSETSLERRCSNYRASALRKLSKTREGCFTRVMVG